MIRFTAQQLLEISNHQYVETFTIRPTEDGMEFEFTFWGDTPMGGNIDPKFRRVFVEFSGSSYQISWCDEKNGSRRVVIEARDDLAMEHVQDVLEHIVDFVEAITEDERHTRDRPSLDEVIYDEFHSWKARSVRFLEELLGRPKTHPDKWEREIKRRRREIARMRRLELYPYERKH